uniref:TbpB n=1 Tax=Neisseria meningitidis TaxID=487 RepID=UPI000B5DBA1B|nr:Chain A, TbpB [Neisseria meningitidis]5KKX_B Chain B, TbpB [Neisseria meningitidis]
SKLTTVLDAVELTLNDKKIKNLDNFSNAAQLVVDGIMIDLAGTEFTRKFEHTINGKTYEVEVCCSNLNYLKYGMLTRKGKQVEQSMFLQGERTDEKEIPTDQNVVYRGSWYGHIANGTSWSGNASDKEGGNRAEFTVNFADKKITGKLTAENRQAQTFTIEGMIQGNGFEGTAKTAESGFDLDQKNTTRTPKAYITDAKVKGGFYGPKAEELGGWFAYHKSDNGSATVVFGAKRQQPVQ